MNLGSQSSKSSWIEHCVGFVNDYATIQFKIQWTRHGNPFPWQLHNVQNFGVVYKQMGDMMAKGYSLCNPWVIAAVWLVEQVSSAFGCS